MTDQQTIDIVRDENYPLKILQASGNNPRSIQVSTELIKTVTEIYKFIEPSHLRGKLLIFKRLTMKELIPRNKGIRIYNMDELTRYDNYNSIIIEVGDDDQLFLWSKISNLDTLIKDDNTIFYFYEDYTECFYVKKTKINIPNSFRCASIYALHYHYLNDALEQYKQTIILKSSCSKFRECWNDPNRIFFKSAPEKAMQESLKEFLSSALRGVEVVREYNLNASKPVDIRVKWMEANKSALIELKWTGKSINAKGKIVSHADKRVVDGLIQLKEYMDMDCADTPNIISKAYLVVIDGRRKHTKKTTNRINSEDGLFYETVDYKIPSINRYYEKIKKFVPPYRMFAEPIIE